MMPLDALLDGLLGLLVLCAALLGWRERRNALRCRAATAKRALAPGYSVITGVTLTSDKKPAITIDVMQQGRDEHVQRGRFDQIWMETSRTQQAQPFKLQLDDGQCVLIEPPSDVLLIDEPDVVRRLTLQTRIRRAEVFHQRCVSIEGELTQSESVNDGVYRGHGERWVMRASHGVMAISSRALWSRYEMRRRFFNMTAIYIGLSIGFHRVAVFGSNPSPILMLIVGVVYVYAFFWAERRSRPWYARKLNERRGGRLEDN